jgi:lysozyme
MTRAIIPAGIDLVKRFEGVADGDPTTVNLDPYMDPVGIWTVGWGHAIRWNGRFLRGTGDRATAAALYVGGISQEQADTLLLADLLDTCRDVELVLKGEKVTDGQFAALVSFAFNCGVGALKRSTLLKRVFAGRFAEAADQFLLWDKAGGAVLPGLTRRRQAERKLFLS